MFVAIVYESLFGNTREIAEAIAEGSAEADPRATVACRPAAEAGPELPRADLLIVGAPTHFLGLPSERSRIMRPRYRPESGSWDLTGPLPRAAA
ncbi:MAG: flavodoxin-like domain-containing protein, partial [Actinobacteria bacterium]|nr:flavodoxin-like domain-containing protein [Actinomycetota bacterium]